MDSRGHQDVRSLQEDLMSAVASLVDHAGGRRCWQDHMASINKGRTLERSSKIEQLVFLQVVILLMI